jgi:hypothetical protein
LGAASGKISMTGRPSLFGASNITDGAMTACAAGFSFAVVRPDRASRRTRDGMVMSVEVALTLSAMAFWMYRLTNVEKRVPYEESNSSSAR